MLKIVCQLIKQQLKNITIMTTKANLQGQLTRAINSLEKIQLVPETDRTKSQQKSFEELPGKIAKLEAEIKSMSDEVKVAEKKVQKQGYSRGRF